MKLNSLFTSLSLLATVACGQNTQNSVNNFTDSVTDAFANGGQINLDRLQWTREPADFEIKDGVIDPTDQHRALRHHIPSLIQEEQGLHTDSRGHFMAN